MCSHYELISDAKIVYCIILAAEQPSDIRFDVWPTYHSTFIIQPSEIDLGDEAVPEFLTLGGQFDLLPHWAKDTTYGRRTFNARYETVATEAQL